jgi:ubiquitin carboxyl-terminal hydrolase 7
MIEVMKPKMTFAQSEIQDGDVICFQAELSEKEYVVYVPCSIKSDCCFRISDFEQQGLLSTPIQFYDLLQNRVLIKFKPRTEDSGLEEFDLVLSKKMNYDTVRSTRFSPNTC